MLPRWAWIAIGLATVLLVYLHLRKPSDPERRSLEEIAAHNRRLL